MVNDKNDFMKKYNDVKFYFDYYHKYTFSFKGVCEEDGSIIYIHCGGNADDIYYLEISPTFAENIYNLDPYSGSSPNGDCFSC